MVFQDDNTNWLTLSHNELLHFMNKVGRHNETLLLQADLGELDDKKSWDGLAQRTASDENDDVISDVIHGTLLYNEHLKPYMAKHQGGVTNIRGYYYFHMWNVKNWTEDT